MPRPRASSRTRALAGLAAAACALRAAAEDRVNGGAKNRVRVTFTNYLTGTHFMYWDGQKLKDLDHVGQTWTVGTFNEHRWYVQDHAGNTVFDYVVRESDGLEQRVAIRKGTWRKTIKSIVESEQYAKYRIGGVAGGSTMEDFVGCVDPVLVGDRVYVRAVGSPGAPRWAVKGARIVAVSGPTDASASVFRVDAAARGAGPLWVGDGVFLYAEAADAHVDATPPREGKVGPLAARWPDKGTWQRFVTHKAPDRDADPLSAVCYGDDVFLETHYHTFVDTHDGAVMARWQDRGEWQRFAFERFVEERAEL